MIGRPDRSEAEAYYFKYIDLVPGSDPQAVLASQLPDSVAFLKQIPEEQSLFRYAPEKWSMRQLLNHISDNERSFAFRALWISRGFSDPLLGYDETIGAAGAEADRISWAAHIEEFRCVRLATLQLFANMPSAGWTRNGIVSGNPVSVRALAFITAGHLTHHLNILRERYLNH